VVTVYLNGAERVTGAGPIWVGDPVSQSFTYPTAFPERPAGLTAKRTADNCIKLSWQPAARANEYVLERIDGVHPTQYPRQRTGMVDSAPILDCEQMSAPQHTYTYTVWGLDINTYAFSSATNVVVGVIPNVTLTASRHQLLSGASDTFRVHVTNPLAQDQTTPTPAIGTRVDLQHRTSGTWITVRHGRTDLNGHVAWKVSPIIGGAWRALVVQSHRYQQTATSVVHVNG
jgi:hypothetical protein